MKRRGLLAGVAVAVASGCLGGAGNGGNEPTAGTDRPESPTTDTEPTVEWSLDAGEGRCAGGDVDAATVTVEDGAVVVAGALSTPTPCHGVALDAAGYDPSADVLRLTVAPADPETEGGCVQCVGAVDYEARVRLGGRIPGTVRVVHRSVDGTETVTSTSP